MATLRQEPTEFTEWWTLLSKQKYHSTECLEPVQPSTHGSPGLFKNTPFWFLRKPVQLTRFFYYFISSFFFYLFLFACVHWPACSGWNYLHCPQVILPVWARKNCNTCLSRCFGLFFCPTCHFDANLGAGSGPFWFRRRSACHLGTQRPKLLRVLFSAILPFWVNLPPTTFLLH